MKGVIALAVLVVVFSLLFFCILYCIYRGIIDDLTSFFSRSAEKVPYPDILEHSMNFCKRLVQLIFLLLALLFILPLTIVIYLAIHLLIKNY